MTIRPTLSHGKPAWRVNYSILGNQKRKFFKRDPNLVQADDPGYKAAEKFAAAFTKKVMTEGPTLAALSAAERTEMLLLHQKMKESGITPAQVLSLMATARVNTPLVSDAVNECITSKIAANRRPGTISQLRCVLGQFAAASPNLHISEVSPAHIESWLATGKYAPSTRRSRFRDVRTLFAFAVRKNYCTSNPCDRVEKISVERRTPGILRPKSFAKLMRVAYRRDPRACRWFALAIFCGIRPEEVNKLTPSNIFLEKRMVHIPEAISKTRQARNVEIPENGMEWVRIDGDMASVRKNRKGAMALMAPVNMRHRFDNLRRQAGLIHNWPHDCMRHSSVTYLYALTNDAGYVTKQHGHSISTMLRHYQATRTPEGEIVTKELAQEFFAIRPPARIRILEKVA